MASIKASNLSYEYPSGVRALDRLSFEVEKGAFVVVMGPNGAGKSTLCLTMNGIIPHNIGGAFYGALSIDGRDTVDHEVHKLAQYVGLIIQNPEAQTFCPTVEDELAFGPENLIVPVEEIRSRIYQVAREVRIDDLLDRGPTDLSGGQIQRVATAAVLTMEPDLMVFDEATSALDPRGTIDLIDLAGRLNTERGMTVLMMEHKSEQIAELADQILILDEGKIVEWGSPKEVFSQVAKLNELNVSPPQVTRLMHILGYPPAELPITIDDAEKMIRNELADNTDEINCGNPDQGKKDVEDVEDVSEEIVIDVRDVTFDYEGEVNALEDITFQIQKGEFLGIIGENGAGKTTLVKQLVGLLKPTNGRVTVFGEDTGDANTSKMVGKVGLVLQNPDHQLFKTSVYEEVEVGPMRLGLKGAELEERITEALDLTGISDLADKHPLSLSWGDRQRVALASILAMRPEILIFDEPTTGQDLAGRTMFMELAKDLNQHDYTIIVITHDLELITRYAERCIVMGGGKILKDAPTKEVFQNTEVLRKTFLEPPQIINLAHRLADLGIPSDILTIEDMAEVLRCRGVGR